MNPLWSPLGSLVRILKELGWMYLALGLGLRFRGFESRFRAQGFRAQVSATLPCSGFGTKKKDSLLMRSPGSPDIMTLLIQAETLLNSIFGDPRPKHPHPGTASPAHHALEDAMLYRYRGFTPTTIHKPSAICRFKSAPGTESCQSCQESARRMASILPF